MGTWIKKAGWIEERMQLVVLVSAAGGLACSAPPPMASDPIVEAKPAQTAGASDTGAPALEPQTGRERSVEPAPQRERLQDAEVLIAQAAIGRSSERLEQARVIVEAELAHAPSDIYTLSVLARLERAEGNLDAAQRTLDRILSAEPDSARAHLERAEVLAATGDRAAALASLDRALAINPEAWLARRRRAQLHAELGHHVLGEGDARAALERNPRDTPMRVTLSQVLVWQGRSEEAIDVLEELAPPDRPAAVHYGLGRIHLQRGNPAEARIHFERAWIENPTQANVLAALLELDEAEDRLDQSLARLDRAVEQAPDRSRLHLLRGQVFSKMGRPAEAEDSFRRAIELDPSELASYQALAYFLATSGRFHEVLASYEAALEQNRDSAVIHLVVGSLLELESRRGEAMARYEDAIRLDPSLGVAQNNLAYLLLDTDLDRALTLARGARRLLPEDPSVADTLGCVLLRHGDTAAAIVLLEEAETGIEPANRGIVRLHLAQAYLQGGDRAAARRTVERSLEEYESERKLRTAGGETTPPAPSWVEETRALARHLAGGPAGPHADDR